MCIAYLCNIDFDDSYSHCINFETRSSQQQYFINRSKARYNINCKCDSFRSEITINETYDNICQFDYLILTNGSNYFYYFIEDFEIITNKATKIYIELDVFNSYIFDIEFMNSFVDRCHVNRWTSEGYPTENFEDEGIDYGYLNTIDRTEIHKMYNNYIAISSVPIGVLTSNGGGTNPPDPPTSCDNWKTGIPSNNLIRFIKGYEGFAKTVYQHPNDHPTIGYGITPVPEVNEFNELKSQQPITEELASKVLYKTIPKYYGKLYVNEMIEKFKIDSQQKFDALCDLVYNGGPDTLNMKHSLPQILSKYPNDEAKVRPVWEKYWSNGGLEGLVLRRKSECNMYFNGIYEKRKINILTPNGNVSSNYINGDGYIENDSCNPTPPPTDNRPYYNNAHGQNWLCPTYGQVTAGFPNYPSGKYHGAIDIANNKGTPIRATKNGKIIRKEHLTDSFGLFIVQDVEGIPDVTVYYAHNSEVLVNVGDKIKQGDIIAKMGTTGNSTGNHCHWEMRYKNVAFDPAPTMHTGDIIKKYD